MGSVTNVINLYLHNYIKGKGIYSAISSPWDYSKHFTLHPLADLFQRQLDFSWKHSGMLQLLHKDYSFRYPLLFVARCSFIQLSELRQCGMDGIAKALKRQQEDSNPGLLD